MMVITELEINEGIWKVIYLHIKVNNGSLKLNGFLKEWSCF